MGDDDLSSIRVKLQYMQRATEDNAAEIKSLSRSQTRQEGLNNSYADFKSNVQALKIESRLVDLEEWKKSQKYERNHALQTKQSNKAIWIPVILTVILFIWSVIREM